jgi:uncharacterized coiled-coil protein SlyX
VEDAPLSETGRILLGPLWFFYTAQLLFVIQSMLSARHDALNITGNHMARIVQNQRHLDTLQARWASQKRTLTEYISVLASHGQAPSDDDMRTLDRLLRRLREMVDHVSLWVGDIPNDSLVFASALEAQ